MSDKEQGIWIPREIWELDGLSIMEKLILSKVLQFTKDGGECFASNGYFADFLFITKGRASQVISKLVSKGFLRTKVILKGKQIEKRVLNLDMGGIKFGDRGYLENAQGISKVINKDNKGENLISKSHLDQDKKDLLQEWLDYRISIRKKVKSEKTLKSLIKKFSENKYQDLKLAIETAIENEYQGFFIKEAKVINSINPINNYL